VSPYESSNDGDLSPTMFRQSKASESLSESDTSEVAIETRKKSYSLPIHPESFEIREPGKGSGCDVDRPEHASDLVGDVSKSSDRADSVASGNSTPPPVANIPDDKLTSTPISSSLSPSLKQGAHRKVVGSLSDSTSPLAKQNISRDLSRSKSPEMGSLQSIKKSRSMSADCSIMQCPDKSADEGQSPLLAKVSLHVEGTTEQSLRTRAFSSSDEKGPDQGLLAPVRHKSHPMHCLRPHKHRYRYSSGSSSVLGAGNSSVGSNSPGHQTEHPVTPAALRNRSHLSVGSSSSNGTSSPDVLASSPVSAPTSSYFTAVRGVASFLSALSLCDEKPSVNCFRFVFYSEKIIIVSCLKVENGEKNKRHGKSSTDVVMNMRKNV